MRSKTLRRRNLSILLAAAPLFCLGTVANAQSTPVQDNKSVQDNDTSRKELARFDQFLDSRQEIAEQIRKNPSLVNNNQFLQTHPALQTYLQQQPGISEELKEDPSAFMRRENGFDRRDDALDRDTARQQRRMEFDQFLDSHREIAEQLRRDPSLANNQEFLKTHPALQQQPDARSELRRNPNAFMRQDNAFGQRDDAFGRRDDARRDDAFDRRYDAGVP